MEAKWSHKQALTKRNRTSQQMNNCTKRVSIEIDSNSPNCLGLCINVEVQAFLVDYFSFDSK